MICALYSSILSLLFLFLTSRVIKARRANKVAIGDGGNLELQRLIRSQSNFCETTPIALILFLVAELSGAPAVILHFCGIILLCGRLLHAYGISKLKEKFIFRVSGMILTISCIAVLAMTNLFLYFSNF